MDRRLWIGAITACLACAAAVAQENPPMAGVLARVDHLVYAGPDLAAAVDKVDSLLGVQPTPGGQHPGRGTRNYLLSLGPTAYLEVIGPDPDQPAPAGARTFGIDALSAPKLVTWAANSSSLAQLVADAAGRGITLGPVSDGSRRRPDGVLLRWQFTSPLTVIEEGLVPFFIDWGNTEHPARTAAQGASLVALRAEHPEPGRLRRTLAALGLQLEVVKGPSAALVATIEGRRGRVELR